MSDDNRILAIRNNVEWNKEQANMPRPESILELSRLTPAVPVNLCASDYGAAANELREKGYTWKEVHSWFLAHGVQFSEQAIIAGCRHWQRSRALRHD